MQGKNQERSRASSSNLERTDLQDTARRDYHTDTPYSTIESTKTTLQDIHTEAQKIHQQITSSGKDIHGDQQSLNQHRKSFMKKQVEILSEIDDLYDQISSLQGGSETTSKSKQKKIDRIKERIKLKEAEASERTPEYTQASQKLNRDLEIFKYKVKNYCDTILKKIGELTEGKNAAKNYVDLNDMRSGTTFIREQHDRYSQLKSIEGTFENTRIYKDLITRNWRNRISVFLPEENFESFLPDVKQPPAIQTDMEYQERLEQFNQRLKETKLDNPNHQLDPLCENEWDNFVANHKDAKKALKELGELQELRDIYKDIIDNQKNILSPKDANEARSNLAKFRARFTDTEMPQTAENVYRAAYRQTLGIGAQENTTQTHLSKCIEEHEKLDREINEKRSSLETILETNREPVRNMARSFKTQFEEIETIEAEMKCIQTYFSQRLDNLHTLIEESPKTIDAKVQEEKAINQELEEQEQETQAPQLQGSEKGQERPTNKQSDITALAQRKLQGLIESPRGSSDDTKRKETSEISETESIEQFAQRFAENHRETMRRVARHTLNIFHALPDQLYIDKNGELHTENQTDREKLTWNFQQAMPIIDGQKQKIHIIAQLEAPTSSTSDTEPQPQKLIMFVKSQPGPEQSHISNFAEGTPMLIGGTIEANDFLLLGSDGNRNLFLATLKKEIAEETHGKYMLVDTTLSTVRREANGKWTYNLAPVTLRETSSTNTDEERIRSKGEDESQGTVVINTANLPSPKRPNDFKAAIAKQAADQGFPQCTPPANIGYQMETRWQHFFTSTCIAQLLSYVDKPQQWLEIAASSERGSYVPLWRRRPDIAGKKTSGTVASPQE